MKMYKITIEHLFNTTTAIKETKQEAEAYLELQLLASTYVYKYSIEEV